MMASPNKNLIQNRTDSGWFRSKRSHLNDDEEPSDILIKNEDSVRKYPMVNEL